MTKPIVREINLETEEIIEREMNAREYAEVTEAIAKAKAQQEKNDELVANRKSALEKFAALGLTEAEIQALAG